MNVLIINCILTTAEHGVIPQRSSIKDCMIVNFAQGFVNLGHRVTLLASLDYKPTQDEDYPFDVVYFPSRCPRVFKPSLLPWPVGMGRWLREHQAEYDMVIASETFQISSLMAARCCGDKLLLWQEMVRHQRLMHRIPSRLWHNVVAPLWMRKATVVPRSLPAREFISRYMPHVSATIVDHGVNGDVLHPGDGADDAFIVVSQLVERKNVDQIVDRFARLLQHEAYGHYHLHIVGDGDQAAALAQQVVELGISDNVTFHGFLSHQQLAGLLRRARALLVDTRSDLNMVSIAEAIASGTPVVTNTVPATAPFIAQNGLGIVRDGWDDSDLMRAITDYDRMHEACLAVRDSLTNTGCAAAMIEIFKHRNHNG